MKNIKTAIVGATGFTGSELARLIHAHPDFDLVTITSESHSDKLFSDVHPQFKGINDTPLVKAKEIDNIDPDLVFLALPHGVSMHYIKQWKSRKFKIVDLSGDYRLSDPDTYERWYDKKHVFPSAFKKAVYGLPEIYEEDIKSASLVANPGCYPTSAILGLYPLVKEGLIDIESIVVDSKSGTTGAGIKAKAGTHYSQVNENFNAYGIAGHRHTIEIEQKLSEAGKAEMIIQFTPHLLPVDRGILGTIYAKAKRNQTTTEAKIHNLYRETYQNQPFVRLRDNPPGIKEVRGTNFCDLYTTFDKRTGNIIVISAIDNLMKGAAGQAIHNANLMFGLDPVSGLQFIALKP